MFSTVRRSFVVWITLGGLAGCAAGVVDTEEPAPLAAVVSSSSDGGGASLQGKAQGDAGSVPSVAPAGDGGASGGDAGGYSPVSGVGELVISEVMYDPSGTEPNEEWIEIFNTGSVALSLDGLVLADGAARQHTISAPGLSVGAGEYAVLARDSATVVARGVAAAAVVYQYDTLIFSNATTGAVSLSDGSGVVSEATYAGWFTQTSPGGKSVQRKVLTNAASSGGSNWCLSTNAWAAGDRGTPGEANDCP